MDRQTELSLIEELLGLAESKSAYLDADVTRAEVARYCNDDWFARERRAVLRAFPVLSVHSSALPRPGSFLRREIAGLPVLLTRDADGRVHAFLNVCRHRGMRLVAADSGCKSSFTCPYHAWTFSNTGALRGVPHEKQGFPGIDTATMGLTRLPCSEQFGWIWVTPDPQAKDKTAAFLAEIGPDLTSLDMTDMQVAESDEILCAANWKLLIEGGLEAYHFQAAHAETIAPYFPDNLSSYQMFGHHIRSVLPRVSLAGLGDAPRETWNMRAHSNLLYTLFPTNQFLVQADHIVWVQLAPLAADQTMIRLSTMVPSATADSKRAHWAQNHAITRRTLSEDFDIGAAVQAGLTSGANTHLTFGRYEGALHQFNTLVDRAVGAI